MIFQMPARTEPTREQARAWIQHLYPPIIGGLETETAWLRRKRPSWRFHSGTLEYFAPIRERIYKGAHPLVDQFFRYYPELAEQAKDHDGVLENLRVKCLAAQTALVADGDFAAAVEAADKDFQSLEAPGERRWYGAFPPEDRANLAAEYVVNAVPPDGVASGYTTRDFWLRKGSQLLQRRDWHRQVFTELEQAIKAASDVTERLHNALAVSRDDLADRHGLPAAIVELD